MVKFYEERLAPCLQFGVSFDEGFDVEEQTTVGGVYTRLRNPFPLISVNISSTNLTDEFTAQIWALYKKVGGTFAAFRLKNPYEYTTNNNTEAPTAYDQELLFLGTDSNGDHYQLIKWYESPIESDTTRKYLRKPVADTVLIGIQNTNTGNFTLRDAWYTVDYTTGDVLMGLDEQKNITNITQAAQAVVTVGDIAGLQEGDSLYFSAVSGMTEINFQRATITNINSLDLTIDLDTTGYSAYSSGGVADLLPQDDETITGGCEFDLPVKFDSRLNFDPVSNRVISSSVSLIEIHNPDPQMTF